MRRLLLIGLFSLAQFTAGQSFGKNKVQYRDFNWSFISSPRFDVYYYGQEDELARFTADVAEAAYEQISLHLRWTLKKRVSIIVYHSHNDFQQTNVTWEYMTEGIGGVTELFKNRVVLPFEGDYKQFRHVIHHELVHAVINDMIYGGNVQSIVSGRVRLQIPLWVNEGLAEYLSMNWDTEADMIIRDLAIHDYIPSIEELDYYLAYKGGQSVWRFIAEKYGREKIGEIFHAMKGTQSAERGFKRALGMDFEGLTEQWHKYLKKEYWPDVAGREEIEDIARRVTDHEKLKNYFNVSPAVSPDGSRIAVLADRSGYANIYIIDAMSGKRVKRLVKGNRSIDFEELKWLQPGISWSPDNQRIVIAAKSGSRDALYLINVQSGEREKLTFDLDGVFTAAWSPTGDRIAFVGNRGGSSDIYLYDLASAELTNLTGDVFSDTEPTWSPDGRRIAFISDRGKRTWVGSANEVDMASHDYSQNDVYTIGVETRAIQRITATEYSEKHPVWAHTTNVLFYSADRNGVWNLYRQDLDNGMSQSLTNILTGVFQLSLTADDRLLVLSGYAQRGWDVYSIPEPLKLEVQEVGATNFITRRSETDEAIADLRQDTRRGLEADSDRSYSRYIFAPEFVHLNEPTNERSTTQEEPPADSLLAGPAEFIPQPYKTRFTLDLVNANAYYNNVFGASGMTQFLFSDIMGDHQISVATELVLTLKYSDYYFAYSYLKRRTDFFFVAFQRADLFSMYYNYSSTSLLPQIGHLRDYGIGGFLSRPFNLFNRIEGGLIYEVIQYQVLEQNPYGGTTDIVYQDGITTLLPSMSWIYDNSAYGFTGPVDGFRQNTTLTVSPGLGQKGIQFQTLKVDLRKYFLVGRNYSFATRLMLGHSTGRNAQRFYLGGIPYWFFGSGETDGEKDDDPWRQGGPPNDENRSLMEEVYLSEYALPLRGTRYSERFGNSVFLMNLEFRFPFINYFSLGFPAKLIFGNIFGHAFLDLGAAWDSWEEFKGKEKLAALRPEYEPQFPKSPLVSTFGLGIKIPFIFLWRIDTAWDIQSNGYSRPQYYVSVGVDW